MISVLGWTYFTWLCGEGILKKQVTNCTQLWEALQQAWGNWACLKRSWSPLLLCLVPQKPLCYQVLIANREQWEGDVPPKALTPCSLSRECSLHPSCLTWLPWEWHTLGQLTKSPISGKIQGRSCSCSLSTSQKEILVALTLTFSFQALLLNYTTCMSN